MRQCLVNDACMSQSVVGGWVMQVWYHRRAIVESIGDGSAELAFTAEILEEDAKNYHCWQHRHWAMERFNLFKAPDDGGLDFVDRLLKEDIRNNSAWNHRYYVIQHTVGFTPEVCASEVRQCNGTHTCRSLIDCA